VLSIRTKESIGFVVKDKSYKESGPYTGKIHSVVLQHTTPEF